MLCFHRYPASKPPPLSELPTDSPSLRLCLCPCAAVHSAGSASPGRCSNGQSATKGAVFIIVPQRKALSSSSARNERRCLSRRVVPRRPDVPLTLFRVSALKGRRCWCWTKPPPRSTCVCPPPLSPILCVLRCHGMWITISIMMLIIIMTIMVIIIIVMTITIITIITITIAGHHDHHHLLPSMARQTFCRSPIAGGHRPADPRGHPDRIRLHRPDYRPPAAHHTRQVRDQIDDVQVD